MRFIDNDNIRILQTLLVMEQLSIERFDYIFRTLKLLYCLVGTWMRNSTMRSVVNKEHCKIQKSLDLTWLKKRKTTNRNFFLNPIPHTFQDDASAINYISIK